MPSFSLLTGRALVLDVLYYSPDALRELAHNVRTGWNTQSYRYISSVPVLQLFKVYFADMPSFLSSNTVNSARSLVDVRTDESILVLMYINSKKKKKITKLCSPLSARMCLCSGFNLFYTFRGLLCSKTTITTNRRI